MAAGRPRKFDSDDLLDRAVNLIWREGPLALSLNEIAARLDVAKPSLTSRYGGKDDFLKAVLERYHAQIDMKVQEAIAQATTVEGIARAYLGSYLSLLSEKPVGPETGCLLAATTDACALHKNSALAETAKRLNARTRSALVDALKQAGAKRPDDLARFLYGQSVALAFLSRSGADASELGDFVQRALSAVSP